MVPHHTFPGDCGICHIPERWDVLRDDFEFDHMAETGYALEGFHLEAACLRCHNDRGPVSVYVARGCGGCHADPHRGELGLVCQDCHNQDNWEPLGLIADHNRTQFPLVATHAFTPCEGCHERATIGDYRGAPVECHLCHQLDAARATPNHILNNFLTHCERCHTPTTFAVAFFVDHDFFPLQGGHAGLQCTQCHVNGLLVAVNPDCFACHQSDYLGAPNHVTLNFSTNCTDCHNIIAWK